MMLYKIYLSTCYILQSYGSYDYYFPQRAMNAGIPEMGPASADVASFHLVDSDPITDEDLGRYIYEFLYPDAAEQLTAGVSIQEVGAQAPASDIIQQGEQLTVDDSMQDIGTHATDHDNEEQKSGHDQEEQDCQQNNEGQDSDHDDEEWDSDHDTEEHDCGHDIDWQESHLDNGYVWTRAYYFHPTATAIFDDNGSTPMLTHPILSRPNILVLAKTNGLLSDRCDEVHVPFSTMMEKEAFPHPDCPGFLPSFHDVIGTESSFGYKMKVPWLPYKKITVTLDDDELIRWRTLHRGVTFLYRPLYRPPGNWGSAGRDGRPGFRYNEYGELDGLLSAPVMNHYLFYHHLHQFNGKYNTRTSGLILWIQNVPTNINNRYPSDFSSKCRLSCCPERNNAIRKGWLRVAFDEQSGYSNPHVDPYHCAGFVHLYCLERFCDFKRICDELNIRPDNRVFPDESHKMALSEVQLHIVREYLKETPVKKTPPSEETMRYPDYLSYQLVRTRIDLDWGSRRLGTPGNHMGRHMGNLEILTALEKQNMMTRREERYRRQKQTLMRRRANHDKRKGSGGRV